MQLKTIAIVGVGLIGGSFALAARRAGLAERITGWDRPEALEAAQASGVIDGVEEAFASGEVSEADLIYLAAPVYAIIEFLRGQGDSLKPGAIVTDAGSTKVEICRAARESLSPQVHFIGGHPMAGSHKTGVEFARADLFRGAPYAITLEGSVGGRTGSETDAVRTILEVVTRVGGRAVIVTPEEHDRAVARISHAPQILATSLAAAVAKAGGEGLLRLAGSGFASASRLAESQWSVWEDIIGTNAFEIESALAEIMNELEEARAAISCGEFARLREKFELSNEFLQTAHEQEKM